MDTKRPRLLGMTAYAAELAHTTDWASLRLPSPTSLSGRLAAARAQRADEARRLAESEYNEAAALVESVLGSTVSTPSVVPLPHSNSLCRTKGCGRTARMVIVVPGELSTEACSPCAAKVAKRL